jgi:EF hand
MTRKILAVLVATLLSSVAFAGDDQPRGGAVFKAMDSNRDQRLSQNEVSGNQELWQQFAALDRDSDGYLTQQEYAAYMKSNDKNK